MNETPKAGASSITRRNVLRAASAVAGVAAGSEAITGFPTIWAQDIKDITLRHIGVSYSVVQAIGDQASKDLGFKVSMQSRASSPSRTAWTFPTSKGGRQRLRFLAVSFKASR
jgi:putative spermidine/putrescine transport system substrate-binding protein